MYQTLEEKIRSQCKNNIYPESLFLINQNLTELPNLSDIIVEGDFHCYGNNLTSLKGSPKIVKGMFNPTRNPLINLEHSPDIVGYCCLNNDNITSLKGLKEIRYKLIIHKALWNRLDHNTSESIYLTLNNKIKILK